MQLKSAVINMSTKRMM